MTYLDPRFRVPEFSSFEHGREVRAPPSQHGRNVGDVAELMTSLHPKHFEAADGG